MQFSDRNYKFLTDKIMGAQYVLIAFTFSQKGVRAENFAFVNESFSTKKIFSNKFPTAQNLGEAAAPALPATTPLLAYQTNLALAPSSIPF